MNFIKSIFDFFRWNDIESTVNNNNHNSKKRKNTFLEEIPGKRMKMQNEYIDSDEEEDFIQYPNLINGISTTRKTETENILPDVYEIEAPMDTKEYDDDVSILLTMKNDTTGEIEKQSSANNIENTTQNDTTPLKIFDSEFYHRYHINGALQDDEEEEKEDLGFNTQFEEEEDELYEEEYEEEEEEEEEWDDEEIEILTSIRNLFSPKINWSLLRWEQKRYQSQNEILESHKKLRIATEKANQKRLLHLIQTANDRKLTVEEEKRFYQAIRGNKNDVLCTNFNIELKRKDFELLSSTNWLGDEVINYYFNLLKEREKTIKGIPNCHFFSTFFYGLLYYDNLKYNYARVRRWTSKIDLFSFDKVIIPLHLGNHWALAVINMKQKLLEYYDSLSSRNDECMEVLKQYLIDEHLDKKKEKLSIDQWKIYYPKSVPKQQNGYDCGVFTCKFAEYTSCNMEFDFSQTNMHKFRIQIGLRILNKSCLI